MNFYFRTGQSFVSFAVPDGLSSLYVLLRCYWRHPESFGSVKRIFDWIQLCFHSKIRLITDRSTSSWNAAAKLLLFPTICRFLGLSTISPGVPIPTPSRSLKSGGALQQCQARPHVSRIIRDCNTSSAEHYLSLLIF